MPDDGNIDHTREDNAKIGYGRPPEKHRFRKGQSGNPKGRPKKPKPQMLVDDADIFRRLDAEEIMIGNMTMTRREAELRRLFHLAVSGNQRAKRLIERLRKNDTRKQQGGVLALPLNEFLKLEQ